MYIYAHDVVEVHIGRIEVCHGFCVQRVAQIRHNSRERGVLDAPERMAGTNETRARFGERQTRMPQGQSSLSA